MSALALRIVDNDTPQLLRVSRRTLQGQLDGVPYLCVGRKKLFDDIAMLALMEKFRCRSSSSPRKLAARHTGALGERNTESALTEALRLLTKPPRPSCSNSGETKRSASTLRHVRRSRRQLSPGRAFEAVHQALSPSLWRDDAGEDRAG